MLMQAPSDQWMLGFGFFVILIGVIFVITGLVLWLTAEDDYYQPRIVHHPAYRAGYTPELPSCHVPPKRSTFAQTDLYPLF